MLRATRNEKGEVVLKNMPRRKRGEKMNRYAMSMIEIMAVVFIAGIIITALAVAIFKLVAYAKEVMSKSDLAAIEQAIVLMNQHTNIRPGWRSCPDTGGTGITDNQVNYLSTIPGVLVDSTGSALTAGGRTEEDLDNHFFYKCGSFANTQGSGKGYDSAGGTWKGEYLKEINKRDYWGYPYVIMIGQYTNSSPTLICSGGGSGTIVTPYGATAATDPNICRNVVLQ